MHEIFCSVWTKFIFVEVTELEYRWLISIQHVGPKERPQRKYLKNFLSHMVVVAKKATQLDIISFTIGMYANLLLLSDLMPVFRIEGILLF